MSNKPPRRTPKPEQTPEPQSEQKPTIEETVEQCGKQLRHLLFHDLRNQLPTRMQNVLDFYATFITKSMKDMDEARFPRALKRHPIHPHRTQESTFDHLVFFHVGDAVREYHKAISSAEGNVKDLEKAITFLKSLLKEGITKCRAEGNHANGFVLMPPKKDD